MFEMSLDKLILLGFLAVMLIGPARLPAAATRLAQIIRQLRIYSAAATDRVKDEFGQDIDLNELKKLDPRQYDPRRIIRDALTEPPATKDETAASDLPAPVSGTHNGEASQ